MTADEIGRLHQSTVGGCANYNPDRTKPLKVEALDVEGLSIYACLNHQPTELGKSLDTCGCIEWCERFEPKERKYYS